MFSNLVQRLTEGGFLTDGMSRPQGADLDVAGIIGSLPTFSSLERNRSGGLFGSARSIMGAMAEAGNLPGAESSPQRIQSGGLLGPARAMLGAVLESNGAPQGTLQGKLVGTRPIERQRQGSLLTNFLGALQQSPMFGDSFRGLANGGSSSGLFGDALSGALSNLGAATGQSQGQQGQQQSSGTRAPGARSVGLF